MKIKYFFLTFFFFGGNHLLQSCINISKAFELEKNEIFAYITTPDAYKKFEPDQTLFIDYDPNLEKVVDINPLEKFQKMEGFGYTLTGGSAQLLWQMSASKRKEILKELFSKEEESIGVSYLRISLGASDLDEKVFSYNDIPPGTEDLALDRFTIEEDRNDLIPVLKEILKMNPGIPIMASPWSAPSWMKTNNSSKGGSLKRECFDVYSDYFVKYIQAMEAEGIRIDAVTVQNEPLHEGNNPSMSMTWKEQMVFIRDYLGPKFRLAGISTKIILYDHNADHIEYPINIMSDSIARQYVDGTAFHLYGGGIDDIKKVHDAFPDRGLYFTEQWIGAPGNYGIDVKWHIKNIFIGASRNWCKTILEWNLAADPNQDPHTKGGCNNCLGALTINGDEITRNPAYYIVAHTSKYVVPGSFRIASNEFERLPNVAYLTPDKKIVLLITNDSETDFEFNVHQGETKFSTSLAAGAIATFVWKFRE